MSEPDCKSIFCSALAIEDESQRVSYLNEACGGDTDLRAEVESLLQAHADARQFMQPPAGNTTLEVGPAVGETVGSYKLRERIGKGGMGVVYVAEQTTPVRRKVALKIIKPGMDTREVIARFQAERQALAMMDHPNIAKVFDGGATDGGRPYFVMELVRGSPITEYCNKACLSTSARLNLFASACRAIQHAHQRGIIHRDIKPSNILVSLHDGNPVVKIIDFGVAKAVNQPLSDLSIYTRFQQIIGTPLYMSPEQAELSGLDIDVRTDIYSLGVVLYELLTGVTPFDRAIFSQAAYDEMRRIIREEEPKKASTRLSGLTHEQQSQVARQRGSSPVKLAELLKGELDWILSKTLEKDRSRRYESCGALAADIDRFLKDEPLEAGPPSASYRFRKLLQRNRTLALTTFVVAASLILGTVFATLGWLRAIDESKQKDKANEQLAAQNTAVQKALQAAETEKRRAVHTAYLADMRTAFRALELNNFALARRILDRYRNFNAQDDPRHWEWRALWLQCQGNAERTIRSPKGIPLLSISPDAKWAAAGGGGVRVWDLTTDKLAHVLIKDDEGCCVKFSPHGDRLYVGDGTGSIRSWSVPAFEPSGRPMMHGSRLVDIEVSADDKWLVALGENGVVTVWDPQTCKRKHRKMVGSGSSLAMTSGKLAIGLQDSILILDPSSLEELNEIRDPAMIESGRALEFSPDGQWIAHSTADPGFVIYRVSDAKKIGPFEGHTLGVRDLAYSPDGKLIASASSDQTILLWDTHTRQPITRLRSHEGDVWSLDFSADGQRLYSGGRGAGNGGQLAVWNISDVVQTHWPIVKPHACGGSYFDKSWFCYSPDGRIVATTKHQDDKPHAGFFLRSSKDLEVCQALSESGLPKTGVRYSPVENLLVVGDWNGSMDFITFDDAARMRPIDRVVVKEGRKVFPIRFTADGQRLLVTARMDDSDIFCAVYSVRDRKPIKSWSIPRDKSKWAQVAPATISPDGQLVATGHSDGVRFWSVNDPVEPVHFPMPGFDALEFSPDGKFLIAGSRPMAIIDVRTMRVVDHLVGHMQHVSAIRFSRDGRRVASAGSGKVDALRIWDFESRREIMTLMVDGFTNRQVEWSPDGNSILMMGGESNLSMWRVPSYEEIRERERRQALKTVSHME